MIDVLSKLRNASKQLLQELGREPTTEEAAAATGLSVDENPAGAGHGPTSGKP